MNSQAAREEAKALRLLRTISVNLDLKKENNDLYKRIAKLNTPAESTHPESKGKWSVRTMTSTEVRLRGRHYRWGRMHRI